MRPAVVGLPIVVVGAVIAMTASPPPHYEPLPTPYPYRTTPEPPGIDWPVAYGRKAAFL